MRLQHPLDCFDRLGPSLLGRPADPHEVDAARNQLALRDLQRGIGVELLSPDDKKEETGSDNARKTARDCVSPTGSRRSA
jgi:hypothetical protein